MGLGDKLSAFATLRGLRPLRVVTRPSVVLLGTLDDSRVAQELSAWKAEGESLQQQVEIVENHYSGIAKDISRRTGGRDTFVGGWGAIDDAHAKVEQWRDGYSAALQAQDALERSVGAHYDFFVSRIRASHVLEQADVRLLSESEPRIRMRRLPSGQVVPADRAEWKRLVAHYGGVDTLPFRANAPAIGAANVQYAVRKYGEPVVAAVESRYFARTVALLGSQKVFALDLTQ